ncbi:hypothetical protein DH2020_032320 [Rehmannia glutinosa]|uniref:RING-type domain-containing protein n=1 Tax=Rehmannia glutinosa TaxID=99300 RepID=A0ABR0VFH5_REHGL
MWRSISHSIPGFGRKKNVTELARACHDVSDDETSSNASIDEGLECPICWESFNIVENVPYVLWCGHTLCKNCVLGLHWATLKFSGQQIQIPLFVSCPWCNLLTFRLFYKGNLIFPSKNFFLLWMVESRNGDRVKSPSSICRDRQQIWSPRCSSVIRNYSSNTSNRRMHPKFPLVILLLIVIFAIPTSAAVLMLYLVITIVFALPSFLVLYFAYPALDWLGREIRT